MTLLKISIVTVCKNAKDALPRTMDSVLSQTYPAIEYIVIDGASTDGTLDLLKEYAQKIRSSRDSRLTTHDFKWISEPDSGIYGAMNKGISNASGEYLLFLNAGDRLSDVGVIDDVFRESRRSDIIYGDIWLTKVGQRVGKESFNGVSLDSAFFLLGSIAHPAAFIRKRLFSLCGNYDESLMIVSDWEFWIRGILLNEGCRVEYLPIAISDHDLDGLSHASAARDLHERERYLVIMKYYGGYAKFSYAVDYWARISGIGWVRKVVATFDKAARHLIRPKVRLAERWRTMSNEREDTLNHE